LHRGKPRYLGPWQARSMAEDVSRIYCLCSPGFLDHRAQLLQTGL